MSAVQRPMREIAVVIPCFRAEQTVGAVLRRIGPEVAAVYVVDDACPNGSGQKALSAGADKRVTLLRNSRNLGVGGATKAGYRRALADGAEIVVKLDADGQMDPQHIPRLIAPIVAGRADYAKGNRFAPLRLMPAGSSRRALAAMPLRRRIANRMLSLVHGVATGYWQIQDPANGYTAIHARLLEQVGFDELADCYFFETDMLFRLHLAGARVADVPLPALYPGGTSTLSLRRVAPRFASLILRRSLQRLRSRGGTRQSGGTASARMSARN